MEPEENSLIDEAQQRQTNPSASANDGKQLVWSNFSDE
jgi:hypothetical protein